MIRDIVAVDRNGGMAKGGATPWNIPEDIAYFHEQTQRFGGNLLIGRGTYEAMMKGLTEREGVSAWPPAGRHLYVLTSRSLENKPGVTIVHSLHDFLADMQAAGKDVWNGSIAEIEPDEVYITRIDANYDCDKFYPVVERLKHFRLISATAGSPQPGEPQYTYEVYARSQR
ncbi:dihydrofolate reductase [Candidatus Saccharibacteria bacterium]|nr:MAG: dihydrofolate reductase [Candidatus Saccharibacteria bacterium]